MAATSVEHIESTPGICGGRPRIRGHRIRVQDVVAWHNDQGMDVDEILRNYPQLTPAEVHAALAYYYDHRREIDRQIHEDDEYADQLRNQ